jgi:chemotaxis signal transduction protein
MAADGVHAVRAWLLDVGGGYRVAAPAHLVVEYLLASETMAVPCTPVHCPGVLLWRERLIPVVDLALVLPARGAATAGWRHTVVLAWQDAPGQPVKYGALVVRAAPSEALVTDDMASVLPEDAAVFGYIANACFMHEERPIPILDVARLFARPLPAMVLGGGEETQAAIGDVADAGVIGSSSSPPRAAEPRSAPDAIPDRSDCFDFALPPLPQEEG